MGVSTNGILVFGIPLEEGVELEFLEDFEYDWWSFTNDLCGEGKSWEERDEFRKNFPVDLVHHCSGEYTMYILAVNGTEITARRGDPKEIDPTKLVVSKEQKQALFDFCQKYAIDWEEPKWYLCSYWG